MKKESKKIFWIQILIICIVVVLVAVIATVTWIETYWSYIDENVFDEEPFSPNMEDDRFCVKIKDEYCEKFISGEMTIEDFGWDNIEKIVFGEQPVPVLYLKNTGERRLKKAIMHCDKLEFVEWASFYYSNWTQQFFNGEKI